MSWVNLFFWYKKEKSGFEKPDFSFLYNYAYCVIITL